MIDVKKLFVKYHGYVECLHIAKILANMGFKVYGYNFTFKSHLIDLYMDYKGLYFKYDEKFETPYFTLIDDDSIEGYKTIEYEDFIKIIKKDFPEFMAKKLKRKITEDDPWGEDSTFEKFNIYNHMITKFQIFEKRFHPAVGEYYQINYWVTGEVAPVKILKVNPNNTYLVGFDVEGSSVRGAPNVVIKNSDIVAPYKPIRSPVGSGFISTNTNMSIRQVHQVSNDMYL